MEMQMNLTDAQRAAIERLFENESLTDNLTDDAARALLEWAQQQILGDADDELVRAAVSAANQSGEQSAQTLIARARAVLTQELGARAMNPTRSVGESLSTLDADANPARDAAPESQTVELNARPSSPDAPRLLASGASAEQPLLTARADAKIAPALPSPQPKPNKSRKSKRKPKK